MDIVLLQWALAYRTYGGPLSESLPPSGNACSNDRGQLSISRRAISFSSRMTIGDGAFQAGKRDHGHGSLTEFDHCEKPSSNASWAVSGFVQRARDVVADIAERIGPDVGNGLVGHGAAALDSLGHLLAKLLLGLRESLRR